MRGRRSGPRAGRRAKQRSLRIDALEPRILFSGSPVPTTTVDLDQPGPFAQEIETAPADASTIVPPAPINPELSADVDVAAAQVAADNTALDPLADPNNSDDTNLPNEEMIGETIQFGVSFENTGSPGNIGYAPYLDLIVPSGIDLDPDGDGTITTQSDVGGLTMTVEPVAKLLEFDFSDPAIAAAFAGADPSWTSSLGVDGTATGTTRIWVAFNHPASNGTDFALNTGFGGPPSLAPGSQFVAGPASGGGAVGTATHAGSHFVTHPIYSSLNIGGAGSPNEFAAQNISAYNPVFNDGDVLYTVQFPFGSYAPGQPPVTLEFEGVLDSSMGATIDQTMFIRSMGGFALGCDPLNNPFDGPMPVDPPIGGVSSFDTVTLFGLDADLDGVPDGGSTSLYGAIDSNGAGLGSDYVTPKVVEIKKDEVSNDHEYATGPSNIITYQIDVDIAEGQRLEDLVISDLIPEELVYVPNSVQISINGNAVVNGMQVYQPWEINPGSGYDGALLAGGTGQLAAMESGDFGNLNGGLLQVRFDDATADSTPGEDDFLLFRQGDNAFGDGGRWDITIEYQAYAPEFVARPGAMTMVDVDGDGVGDVPAPTTTADFFANRQVGGEVLGYNGTNDTGPVGQGNNPNTTPGNPPGDGTLRDPGDTAINTVRIDAVADIDGDGLFGAADTDGEGFADANGGGFGDAADGTAAGHVYDYDTGGPFSADFDGDGVVDLIADVDGDGNADTGTYGSHPDMHIDIAELVDGDEVGIELDPMTVGKHIFRAVDADGNVISARGPDSGLVPGSFVGFELDIDISDFHGFDNVFLEDYLGDGFEYVSNAEIAAGQMFFEGTTNPTGVMIPLAAVTGPRIAARFNGVFGGTGGVTLGAFDPVTGEPTGFVSFVDPHEVIDLAANPIPINPLTGEPVTNADGSAVYNATDELGGDLMTWNFSHVFDGDALANDGIGPYDNGDRFGLFVNGDANGDGILNADEAAFLGLSAALVGSDISTNSGVVTSASIDLDNDGIIDGIDVDGDGNIDMASYLAGGLYDPLNQGHLSGAGDHSVVNSAATGTDPITGGAIDGNGYHYFYEHDTTFGSGLARHDGQSFFTTTTRTLHQDIPENTRIVLRFYARVSDAHDFESGHTGGSGNDSGVDLNDRLSNKVSIEGDEILYLDSDGTVPTDNTQIDTNGDGVGDTPAPDVDGDGNPGSDVDGDGVADGPYGETYQDDDGEFVNISRPGIEKTLIAINGESILDQDDSDGVADAFNNLTGAAGSDGSVDDPAVGVGGSVTYRLRLEFPFGSAEDIEIIDSLPLPVFNLGGPDYQGTAYAGTLSGGGANALNGTGPALINDADLPDATLGGLVGWTFGPDHFIPQNISVTNGPQAAGATSIVTEAHDSEGIGVGGQADRILPEVRINPIDNQISWHFGTWEMDLEADADMNGIPDGLQTAVIDILVTVRVNEDPFADGLSLTNQAEFSYGDTRGSDSINSITQIETLAPELQIRKGILAVSPQGQPDGATFRTNGGVGNSLYDANSENIANHEWAGYGENDHYQTQTSGLTGATGVNGTGADNVRFHSVKGQENGHSNAAAQYTFAGYTGTGINGLFHRDNSGTKEVEDEHLTSRATQSEQNRGRFFVGTNTYLNQVRTGNSGSSLSNNDRSEWVVPGSVVITAVQNADLIAQDDGSTHSSWSSGPGPVTGTIIDDAVSGGALQFFDIPNADGITGDIVDKAGNILATINYETGNVRSSGISPNNWFGSNDYFPEGDLDLYVDYDVADVLVQSGNAAADYQTGAYDQAGGPSYAITNGPTGNLANTATPMGATLGTLITGADRIDPTTVVFSVGGLDTIVDDGAGNLIQTGSGAQVGFINYNTGVYKFDVEDVAAGTHAIELSFTHDGGTVFDTATDTGLPVGYPIGTTSGIPDALVITNFQNAGNVGDYNLVPGTVRLAIDDTASQIILIDVPDATTASGAYAGTVADEAISGTLHVFNQTTGTVGPAVGSINYNTGDYDFRVQVQDTAGAGSAEIKVDYDLWQASEHYLTSNYLHNQSEFTNENQLNNWASFVDSNARNLDAGDVVTYGIFVENIGGGSAYEIEVFDAFFNNIFEGSIGSTGANGSDDTFNRTHFTAPTADFNGAPNDSSAATAAQIQAFLDAFNFKAYLGDGTELVYGQDFVFEYDRGSSGLATFGSNNNQGSGLDYNSPNAGDLSNDGFWQFVLTEGALQAGRGANEVLTNDSGGNVLFMTYDAVLDQSVTPGYRVTNDSILTNYTANPIAANPGDTGDSFTDDNGDGRFTAAEDFIDANGDGSYDAGEFFVDKDNDGVRYAGDTLTNDINGNGEYDGSYAEQLEGASLILTANEVQRDGADLTVAGLRLNKVLLATDQTHTGEADVTISNVRDGLFGFAAAEQGATWDYAFDFADFSDTDALSLNGDTDNNGTHHTAIPHDYVRLAGGFGSGSGNSTASSQGNNIDPNGVRSIDLDAGTTSYVAGTAGVTTTTNDDAFPNTFIKLTEDGSDFRGMATSFFHQEKQDVSGSWETEFEVTLSNRDVGLGRGFAFVIQNDPAGAAAIASGGTDNDAGFWDNNGADRIDNAFAVRFWHNGGDNRIFVHENAGSAGSGNQTVLGDWQSWVNDTDGNNNNDNSPSGADEDTVVKARLTYDADSQILYVTVRDEYGHEFSYQHTVDEAVADIVGGQEAFVGFTAGGDGQNAILINNWNLKLSDGEDYHNARSTDQNVSTRLRDGNTQDRISGLNTSAATRNGTPDEDKGEDVTIGEEVVYGLVIELPEGDLNTFALYDNLPPGLEILDWELVLDPTRGVFGGLATGKDIADATHHTTTPFSVAWGGGNLNSWQNNLVAEAETAPGVYQALGAGYSADGSNGTGAIRFSFLNSSGGLINAPDQNGSNFDPRTTDAQTQDDDPDNVRDDEATSESNNTFMIAIRARVTNDIETSPYEGGGADLDATNLGGNAEAPNANANTRLNSTYARYNNGGFVNTNTTVELDIVEPQLNIEKSVFNRSNPLLDNDNDQNAGSASGGPFDGSSTNGAIDATHDDEIARVGDTLTFRIEIGHNNASTADAFNLSLRDNIAAAFGGLLDANSVLQVRLVNPPAYLISGASTTVTDLNAAVTGAALTGGAATAGAPIGPTANPGAGAAAFAVVNGLEVPAIVIFDGTAATGFSTLVNYAGSGNNIEFDVERLELNDRLIIEIDVLLNTASPIALANIDLNPDNDPDPRFASSSANDGIDARNTANLAYYSVDEISPWDSNSVNGVNLTADGDNINEEAREYAGSDTADVAILAPDIDLGIVKGVLNIATSHPTVNFVDAATGATGNAENDAMSPTGPWAGGPAFTFGSTSTATTILGVGALPDLVDTQADASDHAAHNNWSANLGGTNIVPGSVEFQIQSRLDLHYGGSDVMVLKDSGGANINGTQGYLYLEGDETHTPVGIVDHATGDVEIFQTLFHHEEERVEVDYEFQRNRSNIENPDDADADTNPESPFTPGEHDVSYAEATISGESTVDAAGVLLTALNGDLRGARFRHTLLHTQGNDVNKHEGESTAAAQMNAAGEIVAGTVRVHVYDRHGEYVLIDNGSGQFTSIEDNAGNAITGVSLDTADGTNAVDYSWDAGGFSINTKEFLQFNQVTFETVSGTPSTLTSEFLHPEAVATTTDSYGLDTDEWNNFIDRDAVLPQTLSNGDVVTYGVFVENRGTQGAFDLTLNDALFTGGGAGLASALTPADWVGGTVYDVTAALTGMNFQALRGDGAALRFTATYDTMTGDISIAFDDIDSNGDGTEDSAVLEAGRSRIGGVWTNTLGSNVVMLSYDVTIGTVTSGTIYEQTNVASIAEYSFQENGPDFFGFDPTVADNADAAEVEFEGIPLVVTGPAPVATPGNPVEPLKVFRPRSVEASAFAAAVMEQDVRIFGGSDIFAGFVYGERSGIGGDGDGQDDKPGPILSVLPLYSGQADPGTVLRILLQDDNGNVIGTQTTMADAGGNWLATFPGTVLFDEPHIINIEQTKATWHNDNRDHGFNLRTYFAPAINPSHIQSEVLTIDAVAGRRLAPVAADSMQNNHEYPQGTDDWRLRHYDSIAESGIGGVI